MNNIIKNNIEFQCESTIDEPIRTDLLKYSCNLIINNADKIKNGYLLNKIRIEFIRGDYFKFYAIISGFNYHICTVSYYNVSYNIELFYINDAFSPFYTEKYNVK